MPTPTDLNPAQFEFAVTRQPDEATCGPASLHAVYRYYGDTLPLRQIIDEVPKVSSGGTLAVFLALHALRRGYDVTIYTCNLLLFDPTWFRPTDPQSVGLTSLLNRPIQVAAPHLPERLQAQAKAKPNADLTLLAATDAYVQFIAAGGTLVMEDLTMDLVHAHLRREQPIIAGLNATWLYRCIRENPVDWEDDDVAGEPFGHFLVLHGVDPVNRKVDIADPFLHRPEPGAHHYSVDFDRAIGAIMLGIVTYDAKLLVIRPRQNR